MAGRHLAIALRNSRMFAFEVTDKELLEYTDFQLAALAWLSIQKIMLSAAQDLGPTRVASITSDQLMRDSAGTVSAIASHFRLNLDIDACVGSGIFSHHAKSGAPFDPARRAERLAESFEVHRREIEPVVSWATKIAEEAKISWNLPYPLAERIA